jgi:hypothetical protein
MSQKREKFFSELHYLDSLILDQANLESVYLSKIKSHRRNLKNLGYDFQSYLESFLKYSMRKQFSEIEDFLSIDLNLYDFTQNEVFLVGSLPGGHRNVIQYKDSKKQEEKLKKSLSKEKPSHSNDEFFKGSESPQKKYTQQHSERFSNLICFEEQNHSINQNLDQMKASKKKVLKKKIYEELSLKEILLIRNNNFKKNADNKSPCESLYVAPPPLNSFKIPKMHLEYQEKGLDFDGFGVHGLSLVRLLLHSFPTQKPFDLKTTKFTYVSSSLSVVDNRLLFDLAYSFIPGFPFEIRHINQELNSVLSDMFTVVYPSAAYVAESDLGPKNANCIFLDGDKYSSRKFKKGILGHFEHNNTIKSDMKFIPHLKICIISNSEEEITDDTILYIGSHNMTKAAWGRYCYNNEVLYVSNYEMGVIIPPALNSKSKKQEMIKKFGFKYPARKYTKKEKPFTRKTNKFN